MKSITTILWSVLAVVIIVSAGFFLVGQARIASLFAEVSGCEDIYCYDFNYICCGEDIFNPTRITMGSYSYNYCPTTATRCEVKNINGFFYECDAITWDIFGQVQCSGAPRKQCSGSCTISQGKYGITAGASSADFEIYQKALWDCGSSACTYSGYQIPGSMGCSYTTANAVYDETGKLMSGSMGKYVIDQGRCFLTTAYAQRRVCGNTCESCDTDAECQAKYPTEICSNHILQEYVCKKEGVCLKEVGGICLESGEKSWCGLGSGTQVQCCNSQDCVGFGYNYFCDMTDHVCKEEAQCTFDWDCGMISGCDRDTMSLVEGKCVLGKCQKSTIKSVQCCVEMDCPTNYYCSYPEYTCLEKQAGKNSCPFDCCINEELYYDKQCPSGFYCENNNCKEYPDPNNCYERCDADFAGDFFGAIGCKFERCIFPYILIFIVSFVISAILLFVLAWFIPPLRMLVSNWLLFLIVTFVLAFLLYSLFSIPLSLATASILGGL